MSFALAVVALASLSMRAGAQARQDSDWPMPARDYANTRFSPLTDITPANVSHLDLAFSFSTAIDKGHEAAPIVIGDTMFIVTPYPNRVIAFDRPGYGYSTRPRDRIWTPAAFVTITAARCQARRSGSSASAVASARCASRRSVNGVVA